MDERQTTTVEKGWWIGLVKSGFVRRSPAARSDKVVKLRAIVGLERPTARQLKVIATIISTFVVIICLTLARFAYAPPTAPLIAQSIPGFNAPASPDIARQLEKVDPLPADRSVPLTPVQVQRIMVQAGFPKGQIGPGIAVATAESSLIPNNTNIQGNRVGTDLGLFQINDFYWKEELARIDWSDPQANANLAFRIWQESGWSAWTTYRKNPAWFDAQKAPAPNEIPADAQLILCRSDMFAGTTPNVAQAAHNVAGAMKFTGTIGGYANRNKSTGGLSDHARGLALDFMTYEDERKGWEIADYLIQNAGPLHVSYVMFAGQINTLNGAGWVPFPDRGNRTLNHFDHPHASFFEAPADVLCQPDWKASPPVWR